MERGTEVAEPMSTTSAPVLRNGATPSFRPSQGPGGARGFAGSDADFEVNARFEQDDLAAAISASRRGLMG